MDNSRFSGFSLAPVRELLSRCCYRNELKKGITSSRLGRMLARKGIDLQYYLYSLPPPDVVEHMRNCKRCHSLEQCDDYLNNRNTDDNVVSSFCRNNDAIVEVKDQQDSLYGENQD